MEGERGEATESHKPKTNTPRYKCTTGSAYENSECDSAQPKSKSIVVVVVIQSDEIGALFGDGVVIVLIRQRAAPSAALAR